jgi:hypothetical protein
MRSETTNTNGTKNGCTNMPHPWLNAENVSTFSVPIAWNPDRREVWIGAAGEDLNLGEEAVEDVHSPRRGEESDEDNTVLSYAVIKKDADGHDSGCTRCYLRSGWKV